MNVPRPDDVRLLELDRLLNDLFPRMVALRRRLHAHPEPSGEERETSLRIYQLLQEAGYRVRMGPDGCGVLADEPELDGSVGRLALRADLDALRIHDEKTCDYRSRRAGVMHACGHDSHTATLFGALAALRQLYDRGVLEQPAPVRGLFQPAEETCVGASAMIEVGAMDGVQAILAAHMDPSRPVGAIGLREGVLTANCDEVRFRVEGRGGHAARPHEASDPIAAAANLIHALYQYLPRATDSQDSVVVTVGCIQGGANPNVIPERVDLAGTVRTLRASVRERTFEQIRKVAASVEMAAGVRVAVEFGKSAKAVRNDPRLCQLLESAAQQVVGSDGVQEIHRPSMGSEDFSFYLDLAPGAMMRLGCASESVGGAPLHSPQFDIDERAMLIGARILARAAICWPSNAPDSAPA